MSGFLSSGPSRGAVIARKTLLRGTRKLSSSGRAGSYGLESPLAQLSSDFLKCVPVLPHYTFMARISFALYEAHRQGTSLSSLSEKLKLPVDFIQERIEAARLCFLLLEQSTS